MAPVVQPVPEPYPEELLVYCERKFGIPELATLPEALNILVAASGEIAKCYDKQRGLVDAVKRREN